MQMLEDEQGGEDEALSLPRLCEVPRGFYRGCGYALLMELDVFLVGWDIWEWVKV